MLRSGEGAAGDPGCHSASQVPANAARNGSLSALWFGPGSLEVLSSAQREWGVISLAAASTAPPSGQSQSPEREAGCRMAATKGKGLMEQVHPHARPPDAGEGLAWVMGDR